MIKTKLTSICSLFQSTHASNLLIQVCFVATVAKIATKVVQQGFLVPIELMNH